MEDFGLYEAVRSQFNVIISSPDSATPLEFDMSRSATVSDDLTDVDEPSNPDELESNQPPSKSSRNALMNLLSGPQSSKRKINAKKREKSYEESLAVSHLPKDLPELAIIDPPSVTEQDPVRPNTSDLERVMFSNVPSVSVNDFMTGFKRQKVIEVMSDPIDLDQVEQQVNQQEHQVHQVHQQQHHTPVVEVLDQQLFDELKLYQDRNIKRASARDVLASYKPPEKIKHKRLIPRTMKVVLKIAPDRLQEIQRLIDNPFFTKGTKSNLHGTNNVENKQPVASAFASLMASAKSSTPKLTPLQKLKELEPPRLLHRMFQVQPVGSSKISIRKKTKEQVIPPLPLLLRTVEDRQKFHLDGSYDYPTLVGPEKPSQYRIIPAIHDMIPEPPKSSISCRIYDQFVASSVNSTNEGIPWTQLFKPRRADDLLLSRETSNKIKTWMASSFERLKAQSYTAPRNELIKQQKKRNIQTSYDSFIVPDDWEEEVEEPIEVFVPVLILQGHHGCGKSAAIYAAVEEIHGYVHEINSGQARSRRDLFGTLKEFCTTQLVHSHGLSDFQKGIVLFEDADVLFEQDRTFWTVVQEMINISRKPIVITCCDTSTIPKGILQHATSEDAMIFMDKAISSQISQEIPSYLWWCGYSQQYLISADVIDQIVVQCSCNGSFDIRRALNCLQMVCQSTIKGPKQLNLAHIPKEPEPIKLLSQLACDLDIQSEADVIESNTWSLIETYRQPNELIDIYTIDDSEKLQQKTLSYELNIGQYMMQQMHKRDGDSNRNNLNDKRIKFNQLRNDITNFVGSRTRKLTKIAMEASFLYSGRTTRSSALSLAEDLDSGYLRTPTPVEWWRPERTGIPEGSICKYLTPTAFVTELAPQVRDWARFQQSLDRVEQDSIEKNNISVKKFLGYRDFQEEVSLALGTFGVSRV